MALCRQDAAANVPKRGHPRSARVLTRDQDLLGPLQSSGHAAGWRPHDRSEPCRHSRVGRRPRRGGTSASALPGR
eukprot:6190887-Pleurochrysis_carterae.AAC.8